MISQSMIRRKNKTLLKGLGIRIQTNNDHVGPWFMPSLKTYFYRLVKYWLILVVNKYTFKLLHIFIDNDKRDQEHIFP